MDQLKVVLQHKFWVMAALAILLPPIGWWMETSQIAADTQKRKSEIDLNIKKVQDISNKPSEYPNKDWIAGADKINRQMSLLVDKSQAGLFQRQTAVMVWPYLVQKELDDGKIKYRSDGHENFGAFHNARKFFVDTGGYPDEWRKIVNIIEPFNMTTGDGKVLLGDAVDVNLAFTVIQRAPVDQWRMNMEFTSSQMWDAEEDNWFLRALMEAIARVNKGASKIDDAVIKRLVKLELRGGSPTDLKERREGTQKGQPATNPSTKGSFSLSSGTRGKGPGQDFQPKEFNADDVFGADMRSSSAADTSGKRDKDVINGEAERWVSTLSGKWRKRGFVLRLVMDHREIPTLVAEISASPFPAEIWHIEHTDYDPLRDTGRMGLATAATSVMGRTPRQYQGQGATQAEQEAEQQIQKNRSRVDMALNQSYLAEVIVAGTFIIFDEPGSNLAAADASKPAAGAAALPAQPGAAAKSAATKPAAGGKPAAPAKPGDVTKSPAPSGAATKSAPATAPPALPAAIGSAKTGSGPAVPAGLPAKSPGGTRPAAAAAAAPSGK